MNDTEIKTLWLYMGEGWDQFRLPDDELEPVRLAFWRDTVGDLPAEVVRAAILVHARDPHPPRPGMLRGTAERLMADARGEHLPDVDEAWTEVFKRTVARGFRAGPGEWSHPAVAAVVETIGWDRLCHDENRATLFAQFRDAYRPAYARVDQERATTPVAIDLVADVDALMSKRMRELDA